MRPLNSSTGKPFKLTNTERACSRVFASFGQSASFFAGLTGFAGSDLLTSLRARHSNIEENFAPDRTYAAGASCLLRLMDEREWAFKLERHAA